MPYTVTFKAEQNYIDSEFSGNVVEADIRNCNAEIYQLFEAYTGEKCHLLTDLTQVKSQPSRIAEIWNSAKPVAQHKKLGWWLVAGMNNPILEFIISMISKLGKIKYREFKSREEALAFLSEEVKA